MHMSRRPFWLNVTKHNLNERTDLIPSFDDHTSAKSELEGLISVSAGVELFTVDQSSGVVHGKLVPLLSFMFAVGL